jgi:hypothetical protein
MAKPIKSQKRKIIWRAPRAARAAPRIARAAPRLWQHALHAALRTAARSIMAAAARSEAIKRGISGSFSEIGENKRGIEGSMAKA